MKQAINKVGKATNGKKTTGMSIVMVLFQALMMYKPDLINPQAENAIELVISSGMVGSLGHKLWKNRKIIWEYTKKPLKWLRGIKKARQ